jgi:hypothetical protein
VLEAKAKAKKESSLGITAMLKSNAAAAPKKFSFLDRFTNNEDKKEPKEKNESEAEEHDELSFL